MVRNDLDLYRDFVLYYDDKNLEFNNLKFRTGAPITGHFGIEKGFSVNTYGDLIFDTVRIHSGVDRGAGEIYTPFNFDFGLFYDYGKDHTYGSLLRLFNFKYLFEMRIAHIYPNELDSHFKSLLDRKERINKNVLIGQAGDYGKSSGRHTHTELISIQQTCPTFNLLLKAKFKDWDTTYSNKEVLNFYHTIPKFENVSDSVILNHWNDLQRQRNIEFNKINRYKYMYQDWFYQNTIHTRYSTELLFNGL